jgi:hypothetical protein
VAAGWRRVRQLAEERGRAPSELRLSVRLYLDPGRSMPPEKSIAGSAQEMADAVGAWAGIGVDHIMLDPVARGGIEGRRAAMAAFMGDVAAAV